MAGHIDDFIAAGDVLDRLDVIDPNAVVQLVPEPAQYYLKEADDGVGEVRGDLVGIAGGHGLRLALVNPLFAGLAGDRLAHQRGMQQSLEQSAAVNQLRADHSGALLAEVHAQHPVDPAYRALAVHSRFKQCVQWHLRAEVYAHLAPLQQDCEKLAQAAAHPVPGEQ